MTFQGTIHNGVVVFENGVHLPEGLPVRVELVGEVPAEEVILPGDDPLLNMSKFAVDMGIPDLAANIDHYLYGHPKVSNGE